LEIRQQYTFYGIVLYVASTVFVLYLAMGHQEEKIWNGLFWMIQLFICVNAVLSKLLFNVVLMILMSLISLLLFQLLMGNPLQHPLRFIGIVCLGGCSLSMVFTFLAAIAARAQQNAALMAIMGFPLIIPQLMLLMKISSTSFADVIQAGEIRLMLLLAGLDVLVLVLAIILFPFLWKD